MNYSRIVRSVFWFTVNSGFTQFRSISRAVKPNKIVKVGLNKYKVVNTSTFSVIATDLLARLTSLFGWARTRPVCIMDLNPPQSVRGMNEIDKDSFKKTVTIPTLTVPAKNVGAISKTLKKMILKIPRIKPMIQLADGDPRQGKYKLILINPDTHGTIDKFSEEEIQILKDHDVSAELGHIEVELNYGNWDASEIIGAILPEDCSGFGGFSIIGHVVHLNLRDDMLPYKHIIGQVLLDKVNGAKTVVNKTNTIDNTYRNFQMEVIAGEPNFETYSRENGCKFDMDFSKVYWNPRLATEHERILKLLVAGDILYDMFAGIGPFAVPAAKKKCQVFANDLNPESYKWLTHNFTANKAKPEYYQTFNKDGRDFILEDVHNHLLEVWKRETKFANKIHIAMNLPALAVEFLDVFKGLYKDVEANTLPNIVLPRVYCYTFSKCDNPEEDAKRNVEQKLGLTFSSHDWVRRVRNVAPNKEMLCVSCEIPRHVLFGTVDASENEPPEKRMKSD